MLRASLANDTWFVEGHWGAEARIAQGANRPL